MHIIVHPSLAEIDSTQWNQLVPDNNPFIRHEFLRGLEITGCVAEQTGWRPSHIAVYIDANAKQLIGAMPCYVKEHSYGEYIFDWSWADAHFRHGLNYYPKLSNAVPFTPATGDRLLISREHDPTIVFEALVKAALELVAASKLSSFHSLFLSEQQTILAAKQGLSVRHSTQFHWQNKAYSCFDEFLAQLSSKKRKNIKRERRRVLESNVQYEWLNADELTHQDAQQMCAFYRKTIGLYGGQAYLNQKFFDYLVSDFSAHTLFLFASYEGQRIAAGLYFKSDSTLYGRYWGSLANYHSLHFETCYYQAIEWCIKNGYQRFEAGAQGEHKLARGLEPTTTYSAHWIEHPEFRSAIDNFLLEEEQHIERYQQHMQEHSPFKEASS